MSSLLNKRIPQPVVAAIGGLLLIGGWLVLRPYSGQYVGRGIFYQRMLAEYAKQHDGRLPRSIRAPDFLQYPPRRGLSQTQIDDDFARFERYYDVAWGSHAAEVNGNGFMVSRQRFLIQPAAKASLSQD